MFYNKMYSQLFNLYALGLFSFSNLVLANRNDHAQVHCKMVKTKYN